MGFDLGSKKRDRIQQVGTHGEGNLTGSDSKGKGGRIPDGKPSGRRVHTALAGGAWEAAEDFDSLKGGEATASQTAQGEGPSFFVCLFVF